MLKTPLTLAALFCATTLVSFADESKNRLEQMFRNFDTNRDGGISLDEYKAGMQGNMAAQRIPVVFKEKDRNGDGKLNIDELLVVPKDQQPPAKDASKTDKSDDKKKK